MRKTEAEYLIKRLIGWINPQIASVGHGDFIVTAIDPYDNRRKVYNPKSGFSSSRYQRPRAVNQGASPT